MVVRLIGKINSEPVIFERKNGDRWEAIIPGVPSGVYIVELSAFDEAGNMAYISRFLLSIDLTALCIKVRMKEIGSRRKEKGFFAKIADCCFWAAAEEESYEVQAREQPVYFCRMRVGEPCDCL